jgi:hypothetical protein
MYRILGCVLLLAPVSFAADKEPAKRVHVLLFSDSAIREMQFCCNLFQRETERGRVEMSLFRQVHKERGLFGGVVEDEAILEHFPSKLTAVDPSKAGTLRDNLGWYDVVIAFDPNWSALGKENLVRLRDWVRDHRGVLIVLAGPANFHRLDNVKGVARDNVLPILDLLPVVPGPEQVEPAEVSRRLRFTKAARDISYLRLEKDEPLSGWEKFFKVDGKDEETRGFYSCQPVKSVKKDAIILASFDVKAETPYLVTMKQGKGRVVYVGSSELWRLRQANEQYHERFWTNLARDAVRPGR